jgi:glyoxylase-like metal-dependent hydrolase (beta-lactamase superfamily II)
VICSDERQWVPPSGQRWTTPAELAGGRHCDIWAEEPGLFGLGVTPAVGIGQRGLIVTTGEGNLLWDPPGYLDDDAIEQVKQLGGLRAVTASHPHFYGAMSEWGRAFGADVWVPEADAAWVTRPDPAIRTWHTRLSVLPGVTLIQCGGHFPGSAVVHWADGADGAGALLTGDTIFVTPGEDRLTFVWSAPNRLPLPEPSIRGILAAVKSDPFDRIYGGWAPTIHSGARAALTASAGRYIQFLRGEAPD